MNFLFPNVLPDEPDFLIQECFNYIRNRFNNIRNALNPYLMPVYGIIVDCIMVFILFSLFAATLILDYIKDCFNYIRNALNDYLMTVYGQIVHRINALIFCSLVLTFATLFGYLVDLDISKARDENSGLHVYLPFFVFVILNLLGIFFLKEVREAIANLPYSVMTLIDVALSLGISGLIYYISVYVKRFNVMLVVLAQFYALFFLFLTIYARTILDFSLTTINIGVAITFLTSLDPDKTKSQKDIIGMGFLVLIVSTFIYLLKNIHVKTVENVQAEAAQSLVQNLNQTLVVAQTQAQTQNEVLARVKETAEARLQVIEHDLEAAQSQVQNLNQALAVAQTQAQTQNEVLATAKETDEARWQAIEHDLEAALTQVQNLNQALAVAQTQSQTQNEVLATAKETAEVQETALAEAQIQIEALFKAQMEAQFLNLAMEERLHGLAEKKKMEDEKLVQEEDFMINNS